MRAGEDYLRVSVWATRLFANLKILQTPLGHWLLSRQGTPVNSGDKPHRDPGKITAGLTTQASSFLSIFSFITGDFYFCTDNYKSAPGWSLTLQSAYWYKKYISLNLEFIPSAPLA